MRVEVFPTAMRPAATPKNHSVDDGFLTGGGEMGRLIRELDWSKTSLGPVPGWPQSLRSALSVCLGSRFPIVIYWGDDRTVFYNDSYAEILGKKHPWALGRPCREVWSEIWGVIAPMLQGVVATGDATWSEDQLLVLERGGYPEECYFSFSFSPVRGADGAVDGIFTAVIENTRRVLGERRLQTLRNLATRLSATQGEDEAWRASIDALEDNPRDLPFAVLYRVESDGEPARFVAGRGIESPPLAIDAPTQVFAGAQILPVARPGTAPYGYLVAGISPSRPLDDDYRSFLALLADQIATGVANARAHEEERKRAEALAQIDRAKTDFFSNVSHEFRTPLTLMLGPLDDSLADVAHPLPSTQRERLQLVRRSGLRLQKLVNSLLDFARIEAGRTEASYVPTDLGSLTTDLASTFRSTVEKAGLELVIDCPTGREPVYIDHEMWEKIVLNLVSNAFKFTFEGGITVRLRTTGDHVELIVQDTGGGIPAHELPHLFERFHRVAGTKSRTHEGTGIGLALVQELVKLHSGTVRVESVEGGGTTFTVAIPRGTAHLPADRVDAGRRLQSTATGAEAHVAEALRWLPSQRDDIDEVPAPDAGTARPRILWADDNADMRRYVRKILSARYEVETVENGEAALDAIRRQTPDLVLTDVMMPGLDGFGLLKELRADPRTADVPVILLSARAGEESRIEGMRAGAVDYLVKPFSRRELLACVDAQLRLAQLRREASAVITNRATQFETLLNQAPLGVYLVDADFKIREVNPVALPVFGDIPGGVLDRSFDEIIHILWDQEYADELVGIFRHTLETGESYVATERARQRADRGVTEYYEWRLDRIMLPDGRFGVVCYFRDISAQVHTREALREADRRKDEFLATLSHELRNPLAPLRNALQVLRVAERETTAATPIHEMMERQVNHLVRLVDDLLEMSRISRGTLELRKERLDVASIVENALETSDPLIRAAGHRVNVVLPAERVWIDGDPVRLAQVFSNLLNNAAKYTAAGGDITVAVRTQDRTARISVRDTGVGMRAEALSRVFDLFHRGDHAGQGSGLGVGLTIARRIAELHGGTITAQSAGPGTGSEFTVQLPLSPPEGRPAPAERRRSPRPLPQRVLIVDDNRDAADSLGLLLGMLGADVRVARDGPEALEIVKGYDPAVVLLDIGMPGMDGFEVARRIRAGASSRRPAIVALTGWGQPEDRRRTKEAGFDHHLVKPADLVALQGILSTVEP